MKKQVSLFSRAALAALAAGAVCLAGNASAQNSDASPSPDASASASASAAPSSEKKSSSSQSDASTKSTASTKSDAKGSSGATAAALSSQDRSFMMAAAKGGMMEVHMGQMAEKQGQSADVKKLGARMVTDHTKVNTQLMTLAQAKGVKLDTRHKMDKMDAANFDQMWLAQMMKDHQKDIAAFQTEAKSGTDAELKSLATKTLPTLQKHLQMVQAAQAKVGKGSSTATAPKAKQG